MTLLLLLLLVVPLSFGIMTIVENAQQIADWSQSLATLRVPPPRSGWKRSRRHAMA